MKRWRVEIVTRAKDSGDMNPGTDVIRHSLVSSTIHRSPPRWRKQFGLSLQFFLHHTEHNHVTTS